VNNRPDLSLTTGKSFAQTLAEYKSAVDGDIAQFSKESRNKTYEQFGVYSAEAVEAFTELLARGGKRIRGALAMNSYFMFGGTDNEVAIQAARAVEMFHAYILIIDDIQDRSDVRRGGPTAHIRLRDYHKSENLKSDPLHFGESIAMNASLFGLHSAMQILADIPVSDDKRLTAIRNLNNHFITTIHGQTLDIFNEVVEAVDEDAVNKVLLWKTAYYSFANPMQLGAILAGASGEDLALLEKLSKHVGKLFQITDDIIGIFGSDEETGKSSMDDIREGKRTIIVVKALELADKTDRSYLEQMLGKQDLTQAEFENCKKIIKSSGALDYAISVGQTSAEHATAIVDDFPASWNQEKVKFLSELILSFQDRKS
jgi:geranylgeranyl pyrophosphate synthase